MNYNLCSLSIGYPTKVVAHDINAMLTAGELVCLIGRNGTGKSTLLRTMAGFLPPLAGKATIDDCDISAIAPAVRARKIGVVLTDRIDAMNMSVTDLVAMGRSPYTGFFGRLGEEDRTIVNDALAMVGMENFAQRMVETLSDGERQKVMIAKALAQQTPVILLDEPTAFLDYPSKTETLRLLRRLCHEQGKAILVSTHDLDVALRITDKVWMMQHGDDASSAAGQSQLLTGTTDELKAQIDDFMTTFRWVLKIPTS